MNHIARLFLFGIGACCFIACQYQRPSASTASIQQDTTTQNDTLAAKDTLTTQVDIYIENSGSMNGYVQGNTEFKNALSDLLVLLKYHYGTENIQLFYINSEIYPITVDGDITRFAHSLNPKSIRVGNTASSDLNKIFDQVLSETDTHTLSILLSDCIYSIEGSNTSELLNFQKSQTKDAFLSKSKQGHEPVTALIKLSSTFNGTYWDKNNQTTKLSGQARPYYLCITGTADRMIEFNQHIPLGPATVQGFEHQYVLSSKDFSDDRYYSILTASFNQGRFKPIRSLSSTNYVKGIEDVQVSARNADPLRFAIAIDLSSIPTEEAYKTNPAHYVVLEGDYTLGGITPINKKEIHPSDWIRIQDAEATHIIHIQAKSKVYNDLKFALKKQIPTWVYQTDTEDDTHILTTLNQTFGFKYLVEGIAEAYERTSKQKEYYFELDIPIRKSTASNTGKAFFIVLIVCAAAAIGFMIIKNRNR